MISSSSLSNSDSKLSAISNSLYSSISMSSAVPAFHVTRSKMVSHHANFITSSFSNFLGPRCAQQSSATSFAAEKRCLHGTEEAEISRISRAIWLIVGYIQQWFCNSVRVRKMQTMIQKFNSPATTEWCQYLEWHLQAYPSNNAIALLTNYHLLSSTEVLGNGDHIQSTLNSTLCYLCCWPLYLCPEKQGTQMSRVNLYNKPPSIHDWSVSQWDFKYAISATASLRIFLALSCQFFAFWLPAAHSFACSSVLPQATLVYSSL